MAIRYAPRDYYKSQVSQQQQQGGWQPATFQPTHYGGGQGGNYPPNDPTNPANQRWASDAVSTSQSDYPAGDPTDPANQRWVSDPINTAGNGFWGNDQVDQNARWKQKPSQGQGPQNPPRTDQKRSNLSQLSNNLAQQIAGTALPNVAGLKSSAVDFYNTQRQNAVDQARASAARRGASLVSPFESSLENLAQEDYTRNLGSAYNTIDTNAQQTGYDNLLSALGAVSGLQGQQFGQNLQNRQFGLNAQNQFYNQGLQNRQFDLTSALATQSQQNDFLNFLLKLMGGA